MKMMDILTSQIPKPYMSSLELWYVSFYRLRTFQWVKMMIQSHREPAGDNYFSLLGGCYNSKARYEQRRGNGSNRLCESQMHSKWPSLWKIDADMIFGGITVVCGVLGSIPGGLILDYISSTIRNALKLISVAVFLGAIFISWEANCIFYDIALLLIIRS